MIRGRKKEMIVTPEGINVFPEDVERVLNNLAGVRESAVVGVEQGGRERVHAVLITDEEDDPIVREANTQLEDHQKICGVSVWPGDQLPRTEGTRKIKRRELQRWVTAGRQMPQPPAAMAMSRRSSARYAKSCSHPGDYPQGIGAEFSGPHRVTGRIGTAVRLNYRRTARAAATVADLKALITPGPKRRRYHSAGARRFPKLEPFEVRADDAPHQSANLNLPLARIFLRVPTEGLENLNDLEPPAIFAPNHQSHLDIPALMIAPPAKWRYRIAPAMSKEFFKVNSPPNNIRRERFVSRLNYYLGALVFNAFPIPQREAGARQTMHSGQLASEGWCIVIFQGITDKGEIINVSARRGNARVPAECTQAPGLWTGSRRSCTEPGGSRHPAPYE